MFGAFRRTSAGSGTVLMYAPRSDRLCSGHIRRATWCGRKGPATPRLAARCSRPARLAAAYAGPGDGNRRALTRTGTSLIGCWLLP
jgi:hypothetical protein